MNHPPVSEVQWGEYSPRGIKLWWLRMLHGLPVGSAWRRLALWLRKPLKNAFGPWVDLEIWGLHLRLRSRGNLSEQRLLLMPRFLDMEEREAIAGELKGGGVFFDIGANAGVYSLWAGSLGNDAIRVEAFEPDPELCRSLEYNLRLNGLSRIHVNRVALGSSEGKVILVSGAGNKGENRVGNTGDGNSGIEVEMTTLPLFLKARGIEGIDVLKIDVEGHESKVLEPLFYEVHRAVWPRLVICEFTHDAHDALPKLLAENGYHLQGRGRLNGIYRLGS